MLNLDATSSKISLRIIYKILFLWGNNFVSQITSYTQIITVKKTKTIYSIKMN